jgi:glycine cleavage system H protein
MIKEGLLYTKEHEWVSIDGETAIIGVTDYAQEQLGEITFIELPTVGQKVKVHDEIGSIESSKAASDIYSPLAGEIIEVNTELETQPELLNTDCYEAGWYCKLRITGANGTEDLMDASEYDEYLKGL